VMEVSNGVLEFAIGDRVVVGPGISCGCCKFCTSGRENLCPEIRILGFNHPGGMAEYIAVPPMAVREGWIHKLPEATALEYAALSEPLACCMNGIQKLDVDKRSRVVIVGGGIIGCFHGWLCREKRAERVIIVEKDKQRREKIGRLPVADTVVETPESVEFCNVVIIAARAFPDTKWLAEKLEKGGQLLLFSGVKDEFPHPSWVNLVHYNEWKIIGSYGCTPLQVGKALETICSGNLPASRFIDCVIPLEGVTFAFEKLDRKEFLKAMIRFEE